MSKKLGFMQGRLVKDEKNLIQSFPTKNWVKEFSIANQLRLRKMEWTIDRTNILKNPTEHFTENSAEIAVESLAEISNCLIDLSNERPDLNLFFLPVF